MPQFGRAMLAEWLLDPDFTYLNHGTVGAPPARVLMHAWRGRLWTRVSAQVYDDRSDIERLAGAVLRKLG